MDKLEILFVSSVSSDETYNKVMNIRTVASLDPYQRLFRAVTDGLVINGCNVTCISALPLSASNCNLNSVDAFTEESCCIQYIYPGFRLSILDRMYDLYRNTNNLVKDWITSTEGKKRIVICDSLVLMCSMPSRKICQKHKIPVIAYVTDYPSLATIIKKYDKSFKKQVQKMFDKFADIDLNKYDGYILVAKGLSDLIKIKNKPFCVIEDIISTDNVKGRMHPATDEFTMLYGGALVKRFGVEKLVDSVHILQGNYKMLFYGSGESVDYIKQIGKIDKRICYKGVVSFEDLQEIQRNVDLLINPRPSDEVFTSYSFPSKTLSYMLTGTPVLSTRIPGIPDDYSDYILWFDTETVEGMAERIEEISKSDNSYLADFGYKAQQYAVTHKNKRVQTKKILNFILDNYLWVK